MRGDFTRRPFRRDLHNAGVLHQQGRVWLDGDWNEDIFHRLDLLRQETIDIVGRCGVPDDPTSPADDDFFLVEADPALGAGDFRIHAGRAYVDGILALLDADTTYRTQPDNPDPEPIALPSQGTTQGIVYLEVWQRLVTYLEDPSIRERALEGPDTATRLRTITQIKTLSVPGNRTLGLTCETAQAFLPQPGGGVLSTDQPATSEPEDPCRLPDDALYTGRENRLYRVEIHDAGDVEGVPRPTGPATQFSIAITADLAPGAVILPLASAPTAEQVAALLRTGVARIRDDDGLTETLPIAKVTGATITLARPIKSAYTVAKHATVVGGVARFKWSRDNAAFATRITGVDATRTVLTVELLGRDQVTALKAGDLVEAADDASELGPGRGHLTYLTTDPHPDLFTMTLADPLPSSFDLTKQEERHLLLRRWDGEGWAARDFDEPDMDLGDGVRIRFDKHDLRSGDWWTIATRRVDGSVEQRVAAKPDGTARHYCVLALARWTQATGLPLTRVLALADDAGFNPEQQAKLNSGLQPPGAPTYPKDVIKKAADTSGAPTAAITRFKASVDADPLVALEVSDCRTRFPPLTHLCDCDCTVCVSPESHASGARTIQDAVDLVTPTGGTVCLSPGIYQLGEAPVRIADATSVTLRGQGQRSVLLANGAAVEVRNCAQVTLERFSVITSGGQAAVRLGSTIGVSVSSLTLLVSSDNEIPAIELFSLALQTRLRDNVIVAPVGIAGGGSEQAPVLTACLEISSNLLACQEYGVVLAGQVAHLFDNQICDNTVLRATGVAVRALGNVEPGGCVRIEGNTISVSGAGIETGPAGYVVRANEVTGQPVQEGIRELGGITVVPGTLGASRGMVRIEANRVRDFTGAGIAVRAPVDELVVDQNLTERLAAGIVLDRRGRSKVATVTGNVIRDIGGLESHAIASVGIQVAGAERALVADNILEDLRGPDVTAIRVLAVQESHVRGNSIDRISSRTIGNIGIHVAGFFARTLVASNFSRYLPGTSRAPWIGLVIGPAPLEGNEPRAITHAGDYVVVTAERNYVVGRNVVFAADQLRAPITVEGNTVTGGGFFPAGHIDVDGAEVIASGNQWHGVSESNAACLFIRAYIATVASNRARGGSAGIDLRMSSKQAAVLGNLTLGGILVNGAPLGAPWDALNIDGI